MIRLFRRVLKISLYQEVTQVVRILPHPLQNHIFSSENEGSEATLATRT
jgi:hypothetical protein